MHLSKPSIPLSGKCNIRESLTSFSAFDRISLRIFLHLTPSIFPSTFSGSPVCSGLSWMLVLHQTLQSECLKKTYFVNRALDLSITARFLGDCGDTTNNWHIFPPEALSSSSTSTSLFNALLPQSVYMYKLYTYFLPFQNNFHLVLVYQIPLNYV